MAVMASHAPSPQHYFAKFPSQSNLISVQRDSMRLYSMVRSWDHQIFSCVSGFPQSAIHNSVLERGCGLPWIIIRGIGGNSHLLNSAKNRIEVTCSAGIELRWRAGAQEIGYGEEEEEADGGNVELREKAATTRQRVEELRARVREQNNVDVSLEDLAALYDYPLDHFQVSSTMSTFVVFARIQAFLECVCVGIYIQNFPILFGSNDETIVVSTKELRSFREFRELRHPCMHCCSKMRSWGFWRVYH